MGYWWERKKENSVAVPWEMAGRMNDFTKPLNSKTKIRNVVSICWAHHLTI